MVLLFVELRLGAQLPTQIDVCNNRLVAEIRRYVALCTRKVGHCRAPGRRVGRGTGVGDVGGNPAPREEPDSNACTAKFQSVYLSAQLRFGRRGGILTPPPMSFNFSPEVSG